MVINLCCVSNFKALICTLRNTLKYTLGINFSKILKTVSERFISNNITGRQDFGIYSHGKKKSSTSDQLLLSLYSKYWVVSSAVVYNFANLADLLNCLSKTNYLNEVISVPNQHYHPIMNIFKITYL